MRKRKRKEKNLQKENKKKAPFNFLYMFGLKEKGKIRTIFSLHFLTKFVEK